jgi:hypothetical protein
VLYYLITLLLFNQNSLYAKLKFLHDRI